MAVPPPQVTVSWSVKWDTNPGLLSPVPAVRNKQGQVPGSGKSSRGALLLGVGTCHPRWGPRPVSPGGTPSGLNLLTPTAKLCKRRSSVQPLFPRRRPLFRAPRRGRGTGAPAFAVPPACAAGERTKGDAVTPGGGAPRLPSPRPAPARAPFAATPAPTLVPTRCPP